MKTSKWILAILIIGIIAIAVPVLAAFPTPERSMPEGAGTIVYLPTISHASSLPPPDEASQRISLPDGFAIRIYAQNLKGRPRFMTIGLDGHLYVSLIDRGQVVRLPDRDGNGLADGVEVIASGLNAPHGIEFYNGSLYIASVDRITRLTGPDAGGDFGPMETITTALPAPGGHDTRTVHFGPDGKMYVSVGSSCNLCEEKDPRRATILRFNPDGSIPADNPFANDPDPARQPVYAYGLRNSVDFLWTPSGELWADHNGVDGLGNDTPPEEIVISVQAGASHGWPYCYTPTLGVNTSAEVRDTRLDLPAGFTCDQVVPARFTAPAHSAPLGMEFASGTNFPPEYRSSLYVAFHGSWNTDSANYRDCKIERVILEDGQPVGSETFANGWRGEGVSCGDPATWGRPADVIFGADGEMFISDDKGNRIYRVIYTP